MPRSKSHKPLGRSWPLGADRHRELDERPSRPATVALRSSARVQFPGAGAAAGFFGVSNMARVGRPVCRSVGTPGRVYPSTPSTRRESWEPGLHGNDAGPEVTRLKRPAALGGRWLGWPEVDDSRLRRNSRDAGANGTLLRTISSCTWRVALRLAPWNDRSRVAARGAGHDGRRVGA